MTFEDLILDIIIIFISYRIFSATYLLRQAPHMKSNESALKRCKQRRPIVFLRNGKIYIEKKAEGSHCRARCLLHMNDRSFLFGRWINLPSNKTFPCDIVETSCKVGENRENALLSQIYEARAVTEGNNYSIYRPNVYLIIFDSFSSALGKNTLHKTITFVQNELGGIMIEFLNKVRFNSNPIWHAVLDNSIRSFSNAFAGLGHSKLDWERTALCKHYHESFEHILHQFKAEGYKSMVARDNDLGIPSYSDCPRLDRSEANHIWRPYWLRYQELKCDVCDNPALACTEPHQGMLNYLEKFLNSYPGIPKIAQIWPTLLSHSGPDYLRIADEHFISFFEKNAEELQKAFVFLIGDHGPLTSPSEINPGQMYASNNPFLMISIPEAFRKSDIYEQLDKKSYELLTHFDIHATLMDILKLQPQASFNDTSYRAMQPLSKGSSLLRKWSGERTCHNLPLPTDYCLFEH